MFQFSSHTARFSTVLRVQKYTLFSSWQNYFASARPIQNNTHSLSGHYVRNILSIPLFLSFIIEEHSASKRNISRDFCSSKNAPVPPSRPCTCTHATSQTLNSSDKAILQPPRRYTSKFQAILSPISIPMATAIRKKSWICFLIILLVLVADQVVKVLVKTHMQIGEEIPLIGSWCLLHFV